MSTLVLPRPLYQGFQAKEYGITWHRKAVSMVDNSHPGAVYVGTDFEYVGDNGRRRQAKKFAAFRDHDEYWDLITNVRKEGLRQNLHEIFSSHTPRCLYFDLDGPEHYRDNHTSIIEWLRQYVRWVLGGDALGWDQSFPEPVVLTSSDPVKYSSHVIFPQVQFEDYFEQIEYMNILLRGLPALQVDLQDGQAMPILERVVDHQPYMIFQNFRGPYACKLRDGELRLDSCLEPEGFFRKDPLACFAGHVNPEHRLPLPSVQHLLDANQELKRLCEEHDQRIHAAASGDWRGPWRPSPMDQANLFSREFQKPWCEGVIDLSGLPALEVFEQAWQWLHPDRASQWWSWFRLSGVTCRMLQRPGLDSAGRRRVWHAHCQWSSSYPWFDVDENVAMVEKGYGRNVSGMGLLYRLIRFDNPGMVLKLKASDTASQSGLHAVDEVALHAAVASEASSRSLYSTMA